MTTPTAASENRTVRATRAAVDTPASRHGGTLEPFPGVPSAACLGRTRRTGWARRGMAVVAAFPLALTLAGTPQAAPQAAASPLSASVVDTGRATVTVPLQTTLLFTRSDMAPFTLRLSEFGDADVPLKQNNKRPRGVWAQFQWVRMSTSSDGSGRWEDSPQRDVEKGDHNGAGHDQAPGDPNGAGRDQAGSSHRTGNSKYDGVERQSQLPRYRVTPVNLDPSDGPLPGYQFPLYESGSPYSPDGVVYTAAIQPGLVIVMEHLSLSGYNPTATLTLAQYAEHAPCRLDKFEFKRHTRVDLTLGPVGPTQVDVHQVRGKMTLRGSHRRGGPLGLDVFIEEKVNGRECEAGFNPTLVKGDYAYINRVGRIRVEQIKDYPPSDPNLVGAPVGQAKLTLKTW